MAHSGRSYLPAAGHDRWLPFYDPMVKLLGADSARAALLEQADLRPGYRVLDIGCGTGTFVALVKQLHPDVEVVGLDPDPKALARARRKSLRSGVSIQLDQGFADELPYPEHAFDRVFSCFMLHHLAPPEREAALREVRRVLEPTGRFHLLDFSTPAAHSSGRFTTWLHSGHRLKDNTDERILGLMRQAGLADPQRLGARHLLVGHIAYFQASVPASG
jgi:ubiquinone/menaquinone biosynthesis C-methylase UbiE